MFMLICSCTCHEMSFFEFVWAAFSVMLGGVLALLLLLAIPVGLNFAIEKWGRKEA